MGNRKILRGYIRVDKKGNPIPGHTVLRQKQPTGMNFKPLVDPSTYVCCDPFAPTGTDCSVGGYWVSHEDDLYESNAQVLFTNTTSDSNCNTYTLWYALDSELFFNYFIVQKRTSAGVMVWQKSYIAEGGTSRPTNILVDSEDNLIVACEFAIYKINSGTGAVIWSNFCTSSYTNEFTGANVDSENNIIVNGSIGANVGESTDVSHLYVAKLDGATGAVIAEKYFYDANQGEAGVEPYSVPWTDGTDIYVLPAGFYFNSDEGNDTYQGVALKLDTTLTEVWNTKIINQDVISGDQDGTAIRVFPDGGVLLTTYGQAIIKLDSSGNFVWCADSFPIGSFLPNAVVASDGSVYQFGSSNYLPGQDIVHFNADGTFDWAYNLQNSTDGLIDWDIIPQCLVYKNNVLYLNQPKNTLKLPLTQVPDGTYGNFTIVSDTYIYTNPVVPMTSTTMTPSNTTEWADNNISPAITVTDTNYTQTNSTI